MFVNSLQHELRFLFLSTVNRRTIIFKYKRIVDTLASLDRPDLQPYERSSAKETIRRTIAAIWGSDEIRRIKPTPQDEAAGGNAAVETVLWDAIPSYLRKLDAQCEVSLGKRLPIDVCPIKFASWMGGDRDGNPNVTPEVTKEVILKQRLRSAKLYLRDFNQLYSEMAISSKYSDELEALASTITESKDKREKYRRIVGHLSNRMLKTVRVCEAELAAIGSEAGYDSMIRGGIVDHFKNEEQLQGVEPIFEKAELMEPLKVMYDSLTETGFGVVADGLLLDIIRRLTAFGVTLVPLDIREESTRHTLALDSITQYLGLGSYKEWDEEARISFLQSELSSKRPLINLEDLEMAGIDENAMITIRVFETISKVGKEALGAYVISQAQTTSDVLAVMLLQKEFGMTAENGKMMRVVPLFETLNDLTNAPDVLTRLFKVSQYIGAIKGKQEVMVGYSDSAKDAGR
jgi:phosphoenolpyruvate carboxylase